MDDRREPEVGADSRAAAAAEAEATANDSSLPSDPLQALRDALKDSAATVAPPLVHYTDAAGALGILESGELWATSHRHLNDPSELRAGEKLVCEVMDATHDALPEDQRDTWTRFRDYWRQSPGSELGEVCIASFSEDIDSLGQWRAYADDGRGYALRFDSLDILMACRFVPKGDVGVELVRCLYDEGSFRAHVEVLLHRHCTWIERLMNTDAEHTAKVQTARAGWASLATQLSALACRFKSDSYSTEREWRIVALGRREARAYKYRHARSGIVPYIPIDISDEGCARVSAVWTGPGLDGPTSQRTLELLFRERGFENVEIHHSRRSYRPR